MKKSTTPQKEIMEYRTGKMYAIYSMCFDSRLCLFDVLEKMERNQEGGVPADR